MIIPFSFIKRIVGGAAAPTITSLNYAQGDLGGGGQSVVITGTNLSSATGVSFGGTAATITGNTSTSVTVTLPAKAAGTTTVSVTTPGGTSGTLAFEFWNPSVLAATQWLRGSYGGAPWSGTASAGSSGSRSFAAGTTSPTVGASVGGFTPASCGATNSLVSATTMANMISASAYTLGVLIKVASTSVTVGSSTPFNDPSILADTGGGAYCGMSVSSSGIEPYHLENIVGTYTGPVAGAGAGFATGSWMLVFGTYDGTNLVASINSNAGVSLAKANVDTAFSASSGAAKLNENFNAAGSGGAVADYLEVFAMASALSAANKTKYRLYCNQRYGVSV